MSSAGTASLAEVLPGVLLLNMALPSSFPVPFLLLVRCRFDVLVHMKEIGRVIPVLDLHQSLVVVPITGLYARFTLLCQEVDIDPFLSERLDGSPEALTPGHMRLCVSFCPQHNHLQDVMIVAQGKC